jgi:putative transposase
MRSRFGLCVYGYVVMPEHVHLMVSEPPIPRLAPKSGERPFDFAQSRPWATQPLLADAIHYLKLSFAKRLGAGVFWQKRYYDRNVRDEREFVEKLRYIHRNPVKRGLVMNPEDWKWSSFRHYALREKGVVEIESEWTAGDRERQAEGGGERTFLIPG